MSAGEAFHLQAIGRVHSPYRQKFGIPRQPGLVSAARGHIEFFPPFDDPDAFRGIEGFSHVWVQFVFHQTLAQGWQPLIRPPRLGGREKVGVFASRSPYRPNGLGLSVVAHQGLDRLQGRLVLRIQGMDLLDGTPVLDVKPYVPYADALPNAAGGFADDRPKLEQTVEFVAEAVETAVRLEGKYPQLRRLISQILAQDPRPAWYRGRHAEKCFRFGLYDLDVVWQVRDGRALVLRIETAVQKGGSGLRPAIPDRCRP